ERRARKRDGSWHERDVITHQDDVGRLNSNVGACAHGNTYVCLGQYRCVVDTVADERNAPVLVTQSLKRRDLTGRQHLSPHEGNSQLIGDGSCRPFVVTSYHGNSNTQGL